MLNNLNQFPFQCCLCHVLSPLTPYTSPSWEEPQGKQGRTTMRILSDYKINQFRNPDQLVISIEELKASIHSRTGTADWKKKGIS